MLKVRRLVEKNWGCICIKKSLCVQNASAALSPPLILPTPVSHFNLCLSYNTISPHNHRICSRFTWKKWMGLSGEIESEEKNKMMQIEKESFSKQRWLLFFPPISATDHRGQHLPDLHFGFWAAAAAVAAAASPSPLQSAPFHHPLAYGNRNTADGKFSHKSCHPPNKAIKMFVCIIEGNVLPRVSFKRCRVWLARVCCVCARACAHVQFLKNSCTLGCAPAKKSSFFSVDFTRSFLPRTSQY